MRKGSAIWRMVVLAFTVISCERDSVVNCSCAPVPDNFILSVPYKKAAYGYQCCEKQIMIKFANLMQDSRCPVNTTCVWEGTAIIGISINDNEKEITPLEIHKPIQEEILDILWTIELIELTPVPIMDQTINPNDYIAKIQVHKS
jgi:hypothetical protein